MGPAIPVALAIGPLCAAAVKVAIWLIGFGYAIRFRRALFAVAGILAAATSVVRGLQDSGAHPAIWLEQSVIYWSTPTAAIIVAAFIAGRYDPIWIGREWRL